MFLEIKPEIFPILFPLLCVFVPVIILLFVVLIKKIVKEVEFIRDCYKMILTDHFVVFSFFIRLCHTSWLIKRTLSTAQ